MHRVQFEYDLSHRVGDAVRVVANRRGEQEVLTGRVVGYRVHQEETGVYTVSYAVAVVTAEGYSEPQATTLFLSPAMVLPSVPGQPAAGALPAAGL